MKSIWYCIDDNTVYDNGPAHIPARVHSHYTMNRDKPVAERTDIVIYGQSNLRPDTGKMLAAVKEHLGIAA